MHDTEFAEFVTLAIESLKEETVHHLLQSNADYQRECEEEGNAEQQYIQLDLTKHQRAVCNQLLDCRDRQDLDYSDCSYMAGLYDAFRIMAVLFPEKWEIEKVQKVFSTK